jgi:hypothetical protein
MHSTGMSRCTAARILSGLVVGVILEAERVSLGGDESPSRAAMGRGAISEG